MREIRTKVEIGASVERVWEVLTDLTASDQWNPFAQKASGEVRVGEKLSIFLKPPGAMGMTIKPRVLKAEPSREFRWLGHMVVSGIFDGEHIFEIERLDDGRSRLVQREEFRGLLVWPVLAMIGGSTERGFVAMNAALKERAEAG